LVPMRIRQPLAPWRVRGGETRAHWASLWRARFLSVGRLPVRSLTHNLRGPSMARVPNDYGSAQHSTHARYASHETRPPWPPRTSASRFEPDGSAPNFGTDGTAHNWRGWLRATCRPSGRIQVGGVPGQSDRGAVCDWATARRSRNGGRVMKERHGL